MKIASTCCFIVFISSFFEAFSNFRYYRKVSFEFANHGAFIIHVFNHAMNEDNINKLMCLNKKSKRESKNIIQKEKQNRFIIEE
jgi:hypothetical protein